MRAAALALLILPWTVAAQSLTQPLADGVAVVSTAAPAGQSIESRPADLDVTPQDVAPPAQRRHVAVVAGSAANDNCDLSGGGCGSGGGGVGCGDLDFSGVSCGSDSDPACTGAAVGCVVVAGGVGYLIYRRLKKKPQPDSLDSAVVLPAGSETLVAALARRFDVSVAATAPSLVDLVVTIREATGVAHSGIGIGSTSRHLLVSVTDAYGRSVSLADGALPTTELVFAADESLSATSTALADWLAAR